MAKTGLVYDSRCLLHDNGSMVLDERASSWIEVDHAENARRVLRAFEVLEGAGIADRLEIIQPRLATRGELMLVHTPEHIDRIENSCRIDGIEWVGPEARTSPWSWEPALLSAGAGLACVDHVVARGGNAYALTRPPGHHASADQAMGFCLFNNAAITARYAQKEHGLRRLAIIDWDVHHGNGTQAVFYEDPDVLFISIHQEGLYPRDEGNVSERGSGPGLGANINIPMPAGSGDAGYLAVIDQVVLPNLSSFQPDLIVLSSGQDAAASDPLGRMSVTTEGFREMTRRLVDFGEERGALTVALQEGGYSVDHMPFCVLATIEALAGFEPTLAADPIELDVPTTASPAEVRAVRAALAAIR